MSAYPAVEPTLDGRVVLITGASRGIGAAACHAFARAGASIAIMARSADALEAIAAEVVAAGGSAIAVPGDVTDADQVRRVVDAVVAHYGRLDAAFNNHGYQEVRPSLLEVDEELYDKIMDINVKGTFLSMKYEIPAMMKSGGGAIVNTSSASGLIGAAGIVPYTAAKHAVIGLSKAAAVEFSPMGIRINVLAPGPTATEMFLGFAPDEATQAQVGELTLLKRVSRPEEIPPAAVWLCSDAASYVTGATFVVDGGYTVP